jgi:hypothetical protein
MNYILILFAFLLFFLIYIFLYGTKEQFGTDDFSNSLKSNITKALADSASNLVNAIKGLGESVFSGLANLIKDETVKAANKVAEEAVKDVNIVKDEAVKDAQIVADGTIKVAKIIDTGFKDFANDTNNKFQDFGNKVASTFVNFGNSIKCAFGGCPQSSGTPGGNARGFTDGYNYCIDGMGGSTPGYNECDATGNKGHRDWEKWSLDNKGRIINTNNNRCLDGGGYFADCQDNNAGQQWTVLNIPGRGNMIVNSATSKCLDGRKSPPFLNKCDANDNWMTQWHIGRFNSNLDDGWFRYDAGAYYPDQIVPTSNVSYIKPRNKNRCVDVDINSDNNLHMWDCHDDSNQKFVYNTATKTLQNIKNGKCLDIRGYTNTNGARVMGWDCNGGDNQKWTFDNQQIKSLWNGRCLNRDNNGDGNGTQINMWDCTGNESQKWDYWFF